MRPHPSVKPRVNNGTLDHDRPLIRTPAPGCAFAATAASATGRGWARNGWQTRLFAKVSSMVRRISGTRRARHPFCVSKISYIVSSVTKTTQVAAPGGMRTL